MQSLMLSQCAFADDLIITAEEEPKKKKTKVIVRETKLLSSIQNVD